MQRANASPVALAPRVVITSGVKSRAREAAFSSRIGFPPERGLIRSFVRKIENQDCSINGGCASSAPNSGYWMLLRLGVTSTIRKTSLGQQRVLERLRAASVVKPAREARTVGPRVRIRLNEPQINYSSLKLNGLSRQVGVGRGTRSETPWRHL